jgi:hypothetical protein
MIMTDHIKIGGAPDMHIPPFLGIVSESILN